eukprot:scaffold2792_cov112-Isochrysis_galbana.AAC.3
MTANQPESRALHVAERSSRATSSCSAMVPSRRRFLELTHCPIASLAAYIPKAARHAAVCGLTARTDAHSSRSRRVSVQPAGTAPGWIVCTTTISATMHNATAASPLPKTGTCDAPGAACAIAAARRSDNGKCGSSVYPISTTSGRNWIRTL